MWHADGLQTDSEKRHGENNHSTAGFVAAFKTSYKLHYKTEKQFNSCGQSINN